MAKSTTETVGSGNVEKVDDTELIINDKRKGTLSEEESANESVNSSKTSQLFQFRKTFSTTWRNIQRIINTVLVQDDNPVYGRGTLGIFFGVYISYMQNILLLAVIILRLPWIVGILSLSLTAFAIFLAFMAILFSTFSVAAIATNGSDRLYGGPFTTIAYSLGNQVALVVGVMLCLANCGFTGICLTICAQLIQQYILRPKPVELNLIKLAFENNFDAVQEIYEKPYHMNLILVIAFLLLITFFNSIGKRIIKWICWIPFTIFTILLVGIFISISKKIIQRDTELRCLYEPIEIIPKDRYEDVIPVQLYLPVNYTAVPPISATTNQSVIKHFCENRSFTIDCTSDNTNNCQFNYFNLKKFEWNLKVIKSNLQNHIIDISNLNGYDWRDIIYDIHFFESIIISPNVKFASITGCALLLLPLFTGSICGINISSLLKSPTKNIPTGIFSSLLTMLFLITILAFLLAFGIERHLLLDKYGRGTYPSFPIIFKISYPIMIITGLMLMSITSAIQSMYTAKSLLLSIITSHTIPVPRFFYQRTSKRRKLIAIAITAFLILPFVLVDNLDYISIIASSCMLVALITINLGTIICSTLNFPSFRPTFRFFRSFLAMLGIIACAILLYGCKPLIGITLSAIAILIYIIFPLCRKRFRRGTPYAIVVDIANMLLYSSTQKSNTAGMVEKFGSEPRCIVFTPFPASCDNLLRMAKILSQNRSALCLSLIRDTGDQENIGYEDVQTIRQYMEYIDLSGYATQFKYQKISSLHSIASALASCCGLGVFKSNTVIIKYPSEGALSGLPDSLLYHYHMHRLCVQHCNLIVVKGTFPLKIPPVKSNKTIDIWWIIDNGDVLLMVAKMLKEHKIWRNAKLRLFVVVDIDDDIKQIEKALLLWLINNHYLIYQIEFIQADPWIISDYAQLRSLKIKQRYYKMNGQSWFKYFQRLIGIPDGMPAQSAVDSGFRGLMTNSVSGTSLIRMNEQQQRARKLNKEIMARSSDAVLLLINMPEPPVHLERFWKYLNFLNDISNELKKVLFVRGVDVQSNVEPETSIVKDHLT